MAITHHPPCERCLDLGRGINPSLATIYESEEDTRGANWCVACVTAFLAPQVLFHLATIHHDLHESRPDLTPAECVRTMEELEGAILAGNGDLVFLDIGAMLADPVIGAEYDDRRSTMRLASGDIGPEDFTA